jgi:arylsulfatase
MKPNVLLITVDHWPASLLGVAGHPVVKTPTLDQLARNGMRFTNAYTECPVCIPARRTLMTGTTTRTHGDRVFQERLPMPIGMSTMAQTYHNAGYQTYAVGKLHVYPQRDRIGFDDVILDEEGRLQFGCIDDYELFLGDRGLAGRQFEHGMSNNEYSTRPWHLPEETHPTAWATREMTRVIKRRDPTRPGFWYLSYRHPHPPLVPLATYFDSYRDSSIDEPYVGDWPTADEPLPYFLQACRDVYSHIGPQDTVTARRAFYALCTHIDHQIRRVIGTLREEGLLENTIICFTADHGDMLGNHGLWAKRVFYENSANVPMILMGVAGDHRTQPGKTDTRITGLQDVMPTLLELSGIDIPETVEGTSMVSAERRTWLYGEIGDGNTATRMVHDGRYKLIYYPAGNYLQLFDLETDPRELLDLSRSAEHADVMSLMTDRLVASLYGPDKSFVQGEGLVGIPNPQHTPGTNRGLSGQRGSHWPPPAPSGEGFVSLVEG